MMDNFAGHDLHLETARLRLRPFEDADFDLAVPFYRDPDFLNAMEQEPPEEPATAGYLRRAGKAMAEQGFLFAIVEKASGRTIGETCLQWMNLDRGRRPGEKVMRLPIGIWDKSLWGRGYGKEAARRLMAYAFEELGIDRLCPMDVSADNARSVAMWRSLGLTAAREVDGGRVLDFEISRPEYERMQRRATPRR